MSGASEATKIMENEKLTMENGGNEKNIVFGTLCRSTVFGANGVHRDGAKGIVIDTRTGLVWQDNAAAASTTATWANAITTCENLVLGGLVIGDSQISMS